MTIAPILQDEQERLEILRRYQIMDTDAEKQFDDLTQLASIICKTPIALMSLIDEDRQWFKSRQGLAISETSRDIAFCPHALVESRTLVVPDTLQDQRFADNPLVTGDPNIRFYAGAPLFAPSGHAVGTLCVIDTKPRELSEEQILALEALSRQAIAQMELRLRVSALSETVSELEQTRRNLEATTYEYKFLHEEMGRKNRELEDFTLIVSHDLQEPIRKVRMFGDRLRAKLQDTLSDDTRTYLDRMTDAADRMQTLVTDLLHYSRVTTRSQPFTTVDLNTVLTEVVSDLEGRLHQQNGRVESEALATLEADPTQIRQLFQNLLSNALKFRHEEIPPVVRVQTTLVINEDNDEMVQITVQDNGIGFPQAQADRIFKVFERLENTRQRDGSGVGLAICRKITDRHNGTITATSEPGTGTTFTILLPRHQRPEPVSTPLQTES